MGYAGKTPFLTNINKHYLHKKILFTKEEKWNLFMKMNGIDSW